MTRVGGSLSQGRGDSSQGRHGLTRQLTITYNLAYEVTKAMEKLTGPHPCGALI